MNQLIYDMFKLLIEAGADIDAKDNEGKTALMYILSTKKATVKLINYLVQHGANINDISKDGSSPLIYATKGNNKSILKYLLESGANISIQTKDGKSLYMHAAMNDCLYLIQYLFDNNIIQDVNYVDKNLDTPLIYAVKNKNIKLIQYLLDKGINVNATNNIGASALSIALLNRFSKKGIEILNILIKSNAYINRIYTFSDQPGVFTNKETPLTYAINRKNFDLVKFLVENGADVNMPSKDNKTPLYYSVINTKTFDIVEYLLNKGARVNEIINNCNETVLFIAARYEKIDVIKLLVDHGADITHKNENNNITMNSVVYKRSLPILVDLLINENINFEELNKDQGRSLFHNSIVYQNSTLFNYILEKGVNINHKDSIKSTPLMLAVSSNNIDFVLKILEKKPKINERNNCLESALYIAVKRNNYAIVKLLLEHGAKIDNKNVEINKNMLFNSIRSYRIIKLLFKYGFEINNYIVNTLNDQGDSLLDLPTRLRKYSSIALCLDIGVDPNKYNSKGNLPIHELVYGYYSSNKFDKLYKIIDYYVSQGVDINAKNMKGETLLTKVLSQYNFVFKKAVIEYLINEYQVDINVQNNDGVFFIMQVVSDNRMQIELVKYLIEDKQCKIDGKDNDGNTVLSYALFKGNENIYNYLLEKFQDFTHTNNDKMNYLMCAVNNGDLELAQKLLSKGININDVDKYGRNALFYIYNDLTSIKKVYRNYMYLSFSTRTKLQMIFEFLVEKGIDVHCVDNEGKNILFYINDLTTMKYAVEKCEVDINHRDNEGRTFLFYITSRNSEMIEYAVNNGLDASIKDKSGHTALYYYVKNNDTTRFNTILHLVENGADIKEYCFKPAYSFTYNYKSVDILKAVDYNLNFEMVNMNDDCGDNDDIVKEVFLDYYITNHYIIETKIFVETLKKAIDKKLFNINRINFSGDTPLLYLMRKMNNRVLKEKELYIDLILYMVDHGADLDVINNKEKAPLYYALIFSFELAKEFYERGSRLLGMKRKRKVLINVKNIIKHEECSDDIKCKMIKYLESFNHYDFNKKIDYVYTIFPAIEEKCYGIIDYLLSKKINLKRLNSKKETVLEVAKRVGDSIIINILSKQKELIEYQTQIENKRKIESEKKKNDDEDNDDNNDNNKDSKKTKENKSKRKGKEKGKEEEVKEEEVKEKEVEEEVKKEEVKEEEVEEEVKKEVKHEEVKHEEVKHEEVKHEEVKHEEVKHEEVKHEEVKEEIKHEEVKHEEVKHEEVKHEEVKHEEVKEEIKDKIKEKKEENEKSDNEKDQKLQRQENIIETDNQKLHNLNKKEENKENKEEEEEEEEEKEEKKEKKENKEEEEEEKEEKKEKGVGGGEEKEEENEVKKLKDKEEEEKEEKAEDEEKSVNENNITKDTSKIKEDNCNEKKKKEKKKNKLKSKK